MSTEVTAKPKDCWQCRLTGAAGLVGIGGYIANVAWKNKTFAGRLTFSTLSLAFISLGVARYKQTYPFEKAKTEKAKTEKAKTEKAKTEKAKTENAKMEKAIMEKATTEKT